MSKKKQTIIQLDKKTINKIAAGEVVERPASVVKELIENSIDAGADEITVLVEGYGLDLIKVVDNGCGMSKEDALLSWRSHTTSKLKTVDDLESIASLGFRGEALASIASVSLVEIITREQTAQTGTLVRVKGGELTLVEECDCPPGTTISVRNLFFNVPARKKFLKTPTTELGHIIELASRQALIHPDIRFILRHNKSELLNSPRSTNSLEPIIAVFGIEVARQMLPVNYQQADFKITGYISKPSLSRSSREYEIFFVNKRYIKSKLLSEAIEEGYKTLLMKKRYPVVVLNIQIKSSQVDVNIHPTKKEVRFDDALSIRTAILSATKQTLEQANLWREQKALLKSDVDDSAQKTIVAERNFEREKGPSQKTLDSLVKKKDRMQSTHETKLAFKDSLEDSISSTSEPAELILEKTAVVFPAGFWIKPLGQAHDTYILCETSEGIALVDTHAAHERIRYERLTKLYSQSKLEIQELLQPITLSLIPEQKALLIDYLPQLEAIGISFEHFGGNTFIIRKLPVIMDIIKTEDDIRTFLDELQQEIALLEIVNDRTDLILKTMACHSAVRGGDSIRLSKMRKILLELSACKKPYTCPHGRPTMIKISLKDLEKEFGRTV